MPRPVPASSVTPIDWSTRPISSIATHTEVKSAPLPPYSSGTASPNSPSSPIEWINSTGRWWSRSHCATCGAISVSAKSRTTLRKVSWSEDSSNIISKLPRLDVHVNVKPS